MTHINIRDEDGLILSIKVHDGETKAVKYLLGKGTNPNPESSSYHWYKDQQYYWRYRTIAQKQV